MVCVGFLLPLSAGAQGSSATILLRPDLDCSVKIDGKLVGQVKQSGYLSVNLALGQHLVEADTGTDGRHWENVVDVKDTNQIVLVIPLRSVAPSAGQTTAAQQPTTVQPNHPPAPSGPGTLNIDYDRFENKTTVTLILRSLSTTDPTFEIRLVPPPLTGQVPLATVGNADFDRIQTFGFFSGGREMFSNPGTAQQEVAKSVLLIDGKRWESFVAPPWLLARISSASSVEGRVGSVEFALTAQHQELIGRFLAAISASEFDWKESPAFRHLDANGTVQYLNMLMSSNNPDAVRQYTLEVIGQKLIFLNQLRSEAVDRSSVAADDLNIAYLSQGQVECKPPNVPGSFMPSECVYKDHRLVSSSEWFASGYGGTSLNPPVHSDTPSFVGRDRFSFDMAVSYLVWLLQT
jgi:hypothetical protein